MASSDHSIFKNSFEFKKMAEIGDVPMSVRGIYVLYQEDGESMNVVYVGMARGEKQGIRGRLLDHKDKKENEWTHFSAFEVWDNVTPKQVEDLEGMFRHIYRKDAFANSLNIQLVYKPMEKIKRTSSNDWKFFK
jgi:hypothetical protein